MQTPQATIDIGTNTIRLLVARVQPDGTLECLSDQTVTVRLGQGVDAQGRLAGERMERAAETIAALAQQARALGATSPRLVATSAVRDASNRGDFLTLVQARTGLEVEVVSGEREALLTFQGAMVGRAIGGAQLVADIGGGSTEVVIATDGVLSLTTSLQIGSGRLTERCLASDPPTTAELATARRAVKLALVQLPVVPIDEAILVGGTATTLAQLAPAESGPAELSRGQIAGALFWLLTTPSAEVAADGRVELARARVLPAGALIIEELLAHYAIDVAAVSSGGLREGLLREAAAHNTARQ